MKKSRSHTHYNEIELSILNNDFTNLVLQNCSIYHSLMVINQRGFNFKKSSIYRQIKEGRLQLKLSNLPRYTPSNVSKEKDKSYKRNIEGHTYEDYIEYVKNNQQAIISQMDTVEGIKDLNAPVLLTFEIVQCKFLFAFIIEQQKIENVILKLKELEENIGNELWNKISEIILTDNGKEFYNYEKFQNAFNTSNIYYCHPYSSFEKGSIENTTIKAIVTYKGSLLEDDSSLYNTEFDYYWYKYTISDDVYVNVYNDNSNNLVENSDLAHPIKGKRTLFINSNAITSDEKEARFSLDLVEYGALTSEAAQASFYNSAVSEEDLATAMVINNSIGMNENDIDAAISTAQELNSLY